MNRTSAVLASLLVALPACSSETVEQARSVPQSDPEGSLAEGPSASEPSAKDSLDAGAAPAAGSETLPPEPAPEPRPNLDASAPAEVTTVALDGLDGSGDLPATPTDSSFFWTMGIGNWFVTGPDGRDRDAQSAAIEPPRGDSTRAYRVSSADPPVAVDLWAQLDHPSGRAVDLSNYAGLSFWARLEGASDQLTVVFGASGQYWNPMIDPASFPATTVTVSADWQNFVLLFDDLQIDTRAISSFDFIVGTEGGDFDLWIDNLELLCRDSCP